MADFVPCDQLEQKADKSVANVSLNRDVVLTTTEKLPFVLVTFRRMRWFYIVNAATIFR